MEERKAAKQARINEILEEKALREATEAAISMQKRQNLAAMARNASTPEMSEDLDRKRTRLACKMDILDFFRGYRKAVHKLTADQQKVLQANLHGSALTQAEMGNTPSGEYGDYDMATKSIEDRLRRVNDICSQAFAEPSQRSEQTSGDAF